MSKPLFVLNGPNLNLLGQREPEIYGTATLDDIAQLCRRRAGSVEVRFHQTNHEGELVEAVHQAGREGLALVINPAAYGHTSVALHDALKAIDIPVVECHLSNPARRETFRHQSFVSPVAQGVVSGFGPMAYELAVEAALRLAAHS